MCSNPETHTHNLEINERNGYVQMSYGDQARKLGFRRSPVTVRRIAQRMIARHDKKTHKYESRRISYEEIQKQLQPPRLASELNTVNIDPDAAATFLRNNRYDLLPQAYKTTTSSTIS